MYRYEHHMTDFFLIFRWEALLKKAYCKLFYHRGTEGTEALFLIN